MRKFTAFVARLSLPLLACLVLLAGCKRIDEPAPAVPARPVTLISNSNVGGAEAGLLDFRLGAQDTAVHLYFTVQAPAGLARVEADLVNQFTRLEATIENIGLANDANSFAGRATVWVPATAYSGRYMLRVMGHDLAGQSDTAFFPLIIKGQTSAPAISILDASRGTLNQVLLFQNQNDFIELLYGASAGAGIERLKAEITGMNHSAVLLDKTSGFTWSQADTARLRWNVPASYPAGDYVITFTLTDSLQRQAQAVYDVRIAATGGGAGVLFGQNWNPMQPLPPGATVIGNFYDGQADAVRTPAQVPADAREIDFGFLITLNGAQLMAPASFPNLVRSNLAATTFMPAPPTLNFDLTGPVMLADLPIPQQANVIAPQPGQVIIYYNPVARRKGIIAVDEVRVLMGPGNGFMRFRVKSLQF